MCLSPVLLVDRSPEVGDRYAAWLHAKGAVVHRVHHAPEALAYAREGVAVILLVRDGLPRRLHRSLRLAAERTPILLIGPPDRRYRSRAHAAGIDEILDSDSCHEAIQAAFDRLHLHTRRLNQLADGARRVRELQRLEGLGRFAAGFAHELAGPLDGLFRWVELAERAVQASDTQKVAARLRSVRDSANRVIGVLNDLRAFARDRHTDHAAMPVADLLWSSLELATSGRDRTPLATIRCTLPAGLAVPGDLRLALRNLLTNAFDATPERNIRLTAELRPSGAIRLRVRDYGSGIPPCVLERVLDPFYSTKGENGTGLGLPLARALVEQHRGQLRLRSKAGVGTLATLLIPPSAVETVLPGRLSA